MGACLAGKRSAKTNAYDPPPEGLCAKEKSEQWGYRFKKILDVLPGGVIILDGAGRVQECNPSAQELLGGPLKGALWREVVERAFAPRPDDGHDISLRNGRRVNISTQALDGEPGQILLIKDVTETRRLQDQLSHQQRLSAQGDMAAALAHQIRTPLSTAILYLSNLTRAGFDNNICWPFVGKALARLKDLERLVEEMMLFARGGGLDGEYLPVEGLLRELVREQEPHARAADFEFRLTNNAPDAVVRANRHTLKSALHNLVNNAIEACGRGGRLAITLDRNRAGWLELRFTDNGPGIPAEMRERIFEPFVTTRYQGTGLGLAVVQAVVGAHGGAVTLETMAHQGASFLVRLPLVKGNP